MSRTTGKLRILCLHGFTSNGEVHSIQIRRLVSQLPDYDFLFPDAPHQVEIATQMDMTNPANQSWSEIVLSASKSGHRAWWYAREGNSKSKATGSFMGMEASLDFLSDYIKQHGPVHAIWGFSQGACLAGMLCALLQPKMSSHPLRQRFLSVALASPPAGVIFSGFRARFPQYDDIYEPGIDVPLLHVMGERDPLVSSERSEALIKVCKSPEFLTHPGGHDIPKTDDDIAKIVAFTRNYVRVIESAPLQSSI